MSNNRNYRDHSGRGGRGGNRGSGRGGHGRGYGDSRGYGRQQYGGYDQYQQHGYRGGYNDRGGYGGGGYQQQRGDYQRQQYNQQQYNPNSYRHGGGGYDNYQRQYGGYGGGGGYSNYQYQQQSGYGGYGGYSNYQQREGAQHQQQYGRTPAPATSKSQNPQKVATSAPAPNPAPAITSKSKTAHATTIETESTPPPVPSNDKIATSTTDSVDPLDTDFSDLKLEDDEPTKEESKPSPASKKKREKKNIPIKSKPEETYTVPEVEDNSDSRPHVNVVFIGHVDAGKSTISGNIMYVTGQVDQRTIDKYNREAKARNRESWFLAFIMDTSEEERAKGKTVEVGRAHFDTKERRFTVLDAPGHKNYVPNMIQGAAQADIGILVISARKGEFEAGFDRQGQTREHALLAKTLGISKLIVVVNKMDEKTAVTADGKWNETRYNDILAKLKPFLRKRCGYKVKRDVTFLPISGLTGHNLKDRVPADVCSWYKGPSLIECMNQLKMDEADPAAPLRIPVLDRYTDRGVVAMGKVENGTVVKGQKLMIMPTKNLATVESITLDTGEELNLAKPGENVRIKLGKINLQQVHKGYVLSDPNKPVPVVREFMATLNVLALLPHRPLITPGYKAVLHMHTIQQECSITQIISQVGGAKKKGVARPAFVKSGSTVKCIIKTDSTLCLEKYETLASLGRFTLRDEGKSIAIGLVSKYKPAE